jgi:transcriptional regulator with XRE-family HTH domain
MRRIADELRLARAAVGITVTDVARRASVAPSTVRRIEEAASGISIGVLAAVAGAVGLDLVLRAYPTRGAVLRDVRHARLLDAVRSIASRRWSVRMEVSAGEFGRSADMVLYGAVEVIHLELDRLALDFQAQFRSASRKRDFLSEASDRPVRLVLAIEDTRRNRTAMLPHRLLIQSQLPAGSREILGSIRSGNALGRDGLLWVRGPTEHRSSTAAAGSRRKAIFRPIFTGTTACVLEPRNMHAR